SVGRHGADGDRVPVGHDIRIGSLRHTQKRRRTRDQDRKQRIHCLHFALPLRWCWTRWPEKKERHRAATSLSATFPGSLTYAEEERQTSKGVRKPRRQAPHERAGVGLRRA